MSTEPTEQPDSILIKLTIAEATWLQHKASFIARKGIVEIGSGPLPRDLAEHYLADFNFGSSISRQVEEELEERNSSKAEV